MNSLNELIELQKRVTKKISELKEISRRKFGVSPDMKVSYDLKSVEVLGEAHYSQKKMRLNKFLLLEFGDVYIEEVVVHEYAHFVVNELRKRGDFRGRKVMPHGREFKSVCSLFGIVGKATTRAFDNSKFLAERRKKLNENKKVFYYTCGCKIPHELSVVRHNKIQRGKSSYSCRRCGQTLKFQKQATKLIA